MRYSVRRAAACFVGAIGLASLALSAVACNDASSDILPAATGTNVAATASPTGQPERTLTSPADDDAARIIRAIKDDRTAAAILGSQAYTLDRIAPSSRLGKPIGVGALFLLDGTHSFTGTFTVLDCRGTLQTETTRTWTNVQAFSVVIDDSGKLLQFAPSSLGADASGKVLGAPYSDVESFTAVTIRDLVKGVTLISSNDITGDRAAIERAAKCPPGTADD